MKNKITTPQFLKLYLTLLCLHLPITLVGQISIGRNHPELNWRTIETPHFKIIYHDGVEFLAQEAARVAEHIYEPVTKDLGIEPGHKTPVIVSDYEDRSNGVATPLGHYIFIWARSEHKFTTGPIKWLPEVIVHEFVHQLNFWGIRGFPGFLRELLALGFMPVWFIEGLAQYEAEQWDVHRDMLLRVATEHNALLPAKKLAGFIGADRIEARLVYEQGHSLVRYIATKYGRDKIQKIINKHRAFPFSFNRALKRAIGVGEKALIREWRREIANRYKSNWRIKQNIDKIGKPLLFDLQGVYGVQWSPDNAKIAVVGVEEFDEEVPRLYVYDNNCQNKILLAEPYVNAFFSWSPDSRYIVYSKKRKGRNGSLINDLFVVDVETKKSRALTYSKRATDPNWSPCADKIIYCVHQGPMSNLAIYDLQSQLSSLLTSFENWTEVFTPQWSPDGSQIVFSLFDAQGKRDIGVINADGSGFFKITDDFIDDRYPTWSPDRKQVAFISYRNGYPNLYIKDLENNNIKQITDVPGGIFCPTYLPDKDKIVVIAFEHRSKIGAYCIDLPNENLSKTNKSTAYQEIKWHQTRPVHFDDLYRHSISSSSIIRRLKYNSIFNVRSQLTLPYYGYDDEGLQLGILNLSADPLGKHQLLWSITHRKRTHFFIHYSNTQLLPVIQLTFNKTSLDKGNFISLKNQDLYLWEKLWNVSLTFLIPFNFSRSSLSNHWLWMEGYVSKRENIENEKFDILKPQFRPFQGWTNFVTIGYNWSLYRPDVAYDIHPKSGAVFSIYYRLSDKILYSDIQFDELSAGLILRKELPQKEHVLSTQFRSLFHWGKQPIQSRYALGSSSIRGLEESTDGDRIIVGNFEYRCSLLRDLGLNIWILYFERFCGALFLDIGKAWGTNFNTYYHGKKYNFYETNWLSTTGIILRHRIYILGKIPFVFQVGYGIVLPCAKQRNVFFHLESEFL